MDRFVFQPGVYSTGTGETLSDVLSDLWPASRQRGHEGGAYYLISGFGTHNGGLPFYEPFRQHVEAGGTVTAVLGGSNRMALSSLQLAEALLESGVQVHVINRRHILHAKMYGAVDLAGKQHLVVSSGNFTGPGVKLNLEATVQLGPETLSAMGFSWSVLLDSIDGAGLVKLELAADRSGPGWALLYDEQARRGPRDEGETETETEVYGDYGALIFTLSHADTARIQATRGTNAAKGSQYFWLPKDTYDFFPPLMIRNSRGWKATYSAKVSVTFVDLAKTKEVMVTFEADNNRDFRLGTGPYRSTRQARQDDMAVLVRRDFDEYDLYIVEQGSDAYHALNPYALTHVGHQGKRAGSAPTAEVDRILATKSRGAGRPLIPQVPRS